MAFEHAVIMERKRTERKREAFLLLLLSAGGQSRTETSRKTLEAIASEMLICTRETDIFGWSCEYSTLGMIFTCIDPCNRSAALLSILDRLNDVLQNIKHREVLG